MDLRIQAIHFDIADRLSDFINKKAERLARRFPAITDFEATLRVVKPETAMNKEALIKIVSPATRRRCRHQNSRHFRRSSRSGH